MSAEAPQVSTDSAMLTREQGDALAAEVLAVIPDQQGHPPTSVQEAQWQRDRLRIIADLAALHRAYEGLAAASDALWRTATPYGVTP